MKKLIFIFLSLLVTSACARNDVMYAKFLAYVQDENLFLFKKGDRRFVCTPNQIYLINEKDLNRCKANNQEIKNFIKNQKKMIENIIKPGARYFVTIRKQTAKKLYCDFSTDKKNLSLELVRQGVASLKNDDSEALIEASVYAMENKRGLFGKKYEKLAKCALGIKDEPKKVKNEEENNASQNLTITNAEEKPKIEMSINE